MRLTWTEYQAFRKEFRHLFWPDEDYRLPIHVEVPNGQEWTLYIRPAQLPAVRDWAAQMRQTDRQDRRNLPSNSSELLATETRIQE